MQRKEGIKALLYNNIMHNIKGRMEVMKIINIMVCQNKNKTNLKQLLTNVLF